MITHSYGDTMTKVALVTGAAKRIGAVIAKALHQEGMNVVIHYHHSKTEAEQLTTELNALRPHSAISIQGDIRDSRFGEELITKTYQVWGRLDVLVNNASSFYPTPIGQVTDTEWDDLLGSNLKGAFFISQAAAPHLLESKGTIVNIVDIHNERPLKGYTLYSIAKAGLVSLTKSLARELGPRVRVNAVAPGVMLLPSDESLTTPAVKAHIIDRTCLKRIGEPEDVAEAVSFLIKQQYITGQVIAVDGGRSIKD